MLLGHGAALLLVLIALLGVVPRFDRMFAEFGIKLPVVTVLVIQLSRSLIHYGIILIPLAILLDGGILFLLSRVEPRWLSRVWFFGVLLIAGCLLLLTAIGLSLPLMTVMGELSQ